MTQDEQVGVSVVLPVYNEEECIRSVIAELVSVLAKLDRTYEILAVDDGSTDDTPAVLAALADEHPALRVLTQPQNAGQSAAFGAGFKAALGRAVITMDADGQNDPADIPKLLDALDAVDCCFGYRATRRDTWSKRIGSKIGNGVRNFILGESIIDTGCSLKAFRTERVCELDMQPGMHRFFGSLMLMQGAAITQVPVNHRPRTLGTSKYTNLGRLVKTVPDLLAVRRMKRIARSKGQMLKRG